MQSLSDYQKSINGEFSLLQNRVRSLVKHMAEDGRYKEVILSNILKMYIPQSVTIYTGFCVRSAGRGQHEQSTQIDLMLYDSDYPVLFKEGNFAIVPPEGILGIIEVKTDMDNINFEDVIAKANENGRFIYEGKKNISNVLFNGVFSYDGSFKKIYGSRLKDSISNDEEAKYKVGHIALGKDIFIRREKYNKVFRHFEIADLAFVFFISNLIETMSPNAYGNEEMLWYSDDKEPNYINSY